MTQGRWPLLLALLPLGACRAGPSEAPGTPSIVLVVTEDRSWAPDPRLLAEGLSFSVAFRDSTSGPAAWGALLAGRHALELHPGDLATFAIPEAAILLPEILGLYGYTTGAFVDAGHLPAGFAQGFSVVGSPEPGDLAAQAQAALQWVEARARDPFFLLLGGSGGGDPMAELAPLWAALERQGRLRHAVVALTAWGGPAVAESWGGIPTDATTRVPLVLWGPALPPGLQGQQRTDLVQAVDVVPTLLALAQARPPAGLPGRDLLGPGRSSAVFQVGEGVLSVRTGTHRLVMPEDPAVAAPRLFAVPDDGGAPRDVGADQPDVAWALEILLRDWRQGLAPVTAPRAHTMDPALKQALRDGGYW